MKRMKRVSAVFFFFGKIDNEEKTRDFIDTNILLNILYIIFLLKRQRITRIESNKYLVNFFFSFILIFNEFLIIWSVFSVFARIWVCMLVCVCLCGLYFISLTSKHKQSISKWLWDHFCASLECRVKKKQNDKILNAWIEKIWQFYPLKRIKFRFFMRLYLLNGTKFY